MKFMSKSRFAFPFKIHILFFVFIHTVFQIALGPIQIFGPDEKGYVNTFDRLYERNFDYPQAAGGWITTPLSSLRLFYLAPKLLNLLGVDTLVALRIWSVTLATISLIILQKCFAKYLDKYSIFITFAFCIPSVFIWFSLALREVYIFLFMTICIFSLDKFKSEKKNRYLIFLIIGLIGLISTKNYLWVVFVISILVTIFLFYIKRKLDLKSASFVILAIISSLAFYLVAASNYQINFFLHTNALAVGERSGDSINKLDIVLENGKTREVEIKGDTTLIILNNSLSEKPNLLLPKLLKLIGVDKFINQRYVKRLNDALKTKIERNDIEPVVYLRPGKLDDPIGLLKSCVNFLISPVPWQGNLSFTAKLMSFESVIWVFLYFVLLIKFSMSIISRQLKRDEFLFTISVVFLLGLIVMSGLTEVNLGTSFRHRSIILAPLLFVYISLTKSANKNIKLI